MTSHRVSEGRDFHLRVSEGRLTEEERGYRQLVGSPAVTSAVGGLRKSWWITTALLLILGVIVRYDLVTRDDLGPLGRNADEVEAAALLDQATLAAKFETYPAVHYAGLDVALVDARSIPVNNSGRPIIVADLAVRNTSAVQIRVPLSLINLVAPTGEIISPDRLEYAEHALRLVVEPGEAEQALAVFKLDSALSDDLGQYALQVGEPGRWPEDLPLDGEVAVGLYPKPLDPVGSGNLAEGAIDPITYKDLTISVSEAITSLQYGAYRAPIGQHLAVITVSVTGDPELVQRSTLDQELWNLVDADGRRRPIRVTELDRSLTGDMLSQQLVFYYSTEASALDLVAGSRRDQMVAASFTVEPPESLE